MCDHIDEYTYLPPITLGGPTGNYFYEVPIQSGRWAEYAIDSVANGDVGTAAVTISGTYPPVAASYDGSITFSDQTISNAVYIRIPATTTQFVNASYSRIQSSQKRVFVRIDTSASNSCYVTIRARVRHIVVIPGTPVTVHESEQHLMNVARAAVTNERLGPEVQGSKTMIATVKHGG